MHSAKQEWPATPNWETALIRSRAIEIRAVTNLCQTAVSGNIDQALGSLNLENRRVGYWGIAEGDCHVVSIARDKVLLVSQHPIPLAEGWCDDGWAALRADDASIVFVLEGHDLSDLMSEMGLEADMVGSASAAVMFMGTRLLVYRTAADTARIHVVASHAPFLWEWLSAGEIAEHTTSPLGNGGALP